MSPKESILEGRFVELIPLDAPHHKLVRFNHAKDNNLLRVVEALDRLLAIPPSHDSGRGRNDSDGKRRLKLLCLDGGGVKGFFTILVIQRLIESAHRLEGDSSHGKRPCDYFDLIGGTSTGGLLAIMLGRLQMDALSAIVAYRSLAKEVFHRNAYVKKWFSPILTLSSVYREKPWYSGELLQSVICQTIKNYMPSDERNRPAAEGKKPEDLTLANADPQKSRCFVCAVTSQQHRVERLRSYRSADPTARDTKTYKIWEAARATSAAPLYFPSIKVQGVDYFDGGLESNNPVVEVIEEARQEWPDAIVDIVVSIGTGKGTMPDPKGWIGDIVTHFICRSTDTEKQHERVMKERTFEDVRKGYFRLQGEAELGEIDLADADRLDEIERLANKYLAGPGCRHMIASCAERLVHG